MTKSSILGLSLYQTSSILESLIVPVHRMLSSFHNHFFSPVHQSYISSIFWLPFSYRNWWTGMSDGYTIESSSPGTHLPLASFHGNVVIKLWTVQPFLHSSFSQELQQSSIFYLSIFHVISIKKRLQVLGIRLLVHALGIGCYSHYTS